MQRRLPTSVYRSVVSTIERSTPLDPEVADAVASAMMDWALEKGATHYAHVFYPLTGLTAEKHDSFLDPVGDGTALASFSGRTLVQGEPDVSSFPNGGMRNTFEARGYTGWDVMSPAYVLENPHGNTLCILPIFISMTGEALDHKTPVLRSQQAMSAQAKRVLTLFGHDDQLAEVFDQIAKCGATHSRERGTLTVGVDTLPNLAMDPGDRNRTSPFAFTGNRFEFRAPGSNQTVAGPMVMLNTMMAEALDHCASTLEEAVAAGTEFNEAVQALLTDIITEHGRVIFNGNGYSEQWPVEAEQRGLKNLRTTVDALPELISPEAVALFGKYEVFNEREMHSRYEIGLEQYLNSIQVEANLTGEMGRTIVLPAVLRYQTELAQNVAALAAVGVEEDRSALEGVSTPIAALQAGLAHLAEVVAKEHDHDALVQAAYVRDAVLPAMAQIRGAADVLENLVADDLWSLPTYQEMLYLL